ncbi:MAG: tRNA lysidine(34) synthetase TilS [Bacillota bacterium]|nr:tRNA lysidine(34) synthetase TilS [Bacillota bacterium]
MSIVIDRTIVVDYDKIVVAVSGGIDSMVLLHLLASLRGRRKLELVVAHVDHQKRKASAEDARFVEALCAEYRIPFESMQLEPVGSGNFHDRARKIRYSFFRDVAKRYGATKIALAHQADDQAETILIRLVRGAALAGYAGIPEYAKKDGVELVRPLLHTSRAEIAAYQALHDIPYRIDESNAEDVYTRNRFRHRLMPEIAKENPRYLQKFAQFAAYIDEAHAVVRRLADEFVAAAVRFETDRVGFSASAFLRLEAAVRKEVVKLGFDRLTGDAIELSHAQMLAAIGIISAIKPHGSFDLPGGCRIEKNYDSVAFTRHTVGAMPFSVPIPGFGRYPLPDGSVLSVAAKPDNIDGIQMELCYNYLDFIFPMTLRTRKNGDRIAFAYGTKKLKDLFIDRKLPMDERNRMALLIGKTGEVLWIPGLNIKSAAPTGRETIYLSYTRG